MAEEGGSEKVTLRQFIQVQMDAMNEKLDSLEKLLKKNIDDHEERIRCLERSKTSQSFWNYGLVGTIVAAVAAALGIKPN